MIRSQNMQVSALTAVLILLLRQHHHPDAMAWTSPSTRRFTRCHAANLRTRKRPRGMVDRPSNNAFSWMETKHRLSTALCQSETADMDDPSNSVASSAVNAKSSRTPSTTSSSKPSRRPRRKRKDSATAQPVSLRSALAVVPPDDAWDTLQRARFLAQDSTYHQWPPCIRLFHPFDTSVPALDLAYVVEKYQVEPLRITLNHWSIVPHTEALEAHFHQQQAAAQQQMASSSETTTNAPHERDQVQDLIARIEQEGRENLRLRQDRLAARLSREKADAAAQNHTSTADDAPTDADETKAAPPATNVESLSRKNARGRYRKKNIPPDKSSSDYQEFDGPCVICLEPDQASKERLQEWRDVLQRELFPSLKQPTSPTSIYGGALPRERTVEGEDYRPVLPIANFETVAEALPVARKLRSLWKPLQFDVTDWQILSCSDTTPATSRVTTATSAAPAFGCDAMVMLMGHEIEQDEDLNQEMVHFVCDNGQDGGYARGGMDGGRPVVPTRAGNGDNEDQARNEDGSSIEEWLSLDDEEDFDEGTVVVIGRSMFFTGATRDFVGMPASIAMDFKKPRRKDG